MLSKLVLSAYQYIYRKVEIACPSLPAAPAYWNSFTGTGPGRNVLDLSSKSFFCHYLISFLNTNGINSSSSQLHSLPTKAVSTLNAPFPYAAQDPEQKIWIMLIII
jgi:hypothetical protein